MQRFAGALHPSTRFQQPYNKGHRSLAGCNRGRALSMIPPSGARGKCDARTAQTIYKTGLTRLAQATLHVMACVRCVWRINVCVTVCVCMLGGVGVGEQLEV